MRTPLGCNCELFIVWIFPLVALETHVAHIATLFHPENYSLSLLDANQLYSITQ